LWIRDVYPGSRILIFTYPGSRIPDQLLKKKIRGNFQRILELFAQKIVTKLSKIWVWDPGSRKNLFWIPDPVVNKDPGSATLLPA
jgi:hypothetical protein